MVQLAGSVTRYPARASVAWYFGMIAAGTLLLSRPFARHADSAPISWIDALFTATSATCVTGLTVRSTEHDFSRPGQLVILLLIQLGGIGIMTVTTYFMFTVRQRQSLRARAVVAETLGADGRTDLGVILKGVLWTTLIIQGIGFVLLLGHGLMEYSPGIAAWHALFHTVSAFCNAGFALHDDSLVRYQADLVVNAVIGSLIVLGGLGFPVILDIRRHWQKRWWDLWMDLHLHSKLMLIGTAAFLVLGTVSFLVLEWDGILLEMPYWQRPLVAMFHSITCRTAGFNTVDVARLTNATLFISILLMIVGAGPGSTAGGFKVSTVMVLVLTSISTMRGYTRINVFRRSIPMPVVERAMTTALLFAVVAVIALTSMLVIEQSTLPHPKSQGLFLDAAFEVTSALGTVGLSTGMTPSLSTLGRLVLILLMFLGRLGPISAFIALSRAERSVPYEYPAEEPLIG